MKILREPTKQDVLNVIFKKGWTLCNSSEIDIEVDNIKQDKSREKYTIPYKKEDCIHFIREFEGYWNSDFNICCEDLIDVLDYEEEAWEDYCNKYGIDENIDSGQIK